VRSPHDIDWCGVTGLQLTHFKELDIADLPAPQIDRNVVVIAISAQGAPTCIATQYCSFDFSLMERRIRRLFK
jgi:hypothetical protein